eukprot:4638281-Prymnesium_polylepis.1
MRLTKAAKPATRSRSACRCRRAREGHACGPACSDGVDARGRDEISQADGACAWCVNGAETYMYTALLTLQRPPSDRPHRRRSPPLSI